jgi:hypothetical protein
MNKQKQTSWNDLWKLGMDCHTVKLMKCQENFNFLWH